MDSNGPLTQMMLENSELIGDAIETYGAEAVSAFFVNVGTSMAALYEVTEIDGEKEIPVINEGA